MAKSKHIPDDLRSLPRTAAVARRLGSKFYFTGERCKRGHLDVRHAKNSDCRSCVNEKAKLKTAETAPARAVVAAQRKADREAALAADQVALEEARLARMAEDGTEAVLAEEDAAEEEKLRNDRVRRWQATLEKMEEMGTSEYRAANAAQVRARYWADPQAQRDRINKRHREGTSGYRMFRLRTPWWLDDEELDLLDGFEKETHERGLEMDHIVPIDFEGCPVVGIHVPWNLQAATKAENNQRRKGCINEFTWTDDEVARYVADGMAVWRTELGRTGVVDWVRNPRPAH